MAAERGSAGGGLYLLAEAGTQVLLEGDELGAEFLGPQALQVRVARVALGVPLVGERARLDLAQHLAHYRGNVEAVVPIRPRQLAVLAGRRVVAHLAGVALLPQQPVAPLDLARE